MGKRLIIFVLLIAASPAFAGTFPNAYSTKTVPVAADKLLGTDSENSDATVVMTAGSLPVSTPVQTALDLKQGLITLGTPNGLYFEGTILSMYAATNTNAGAATAAQITELERLGTATPSWVDGQAGAWWATSEINTVDPVTYSSGRIGLAPYGTSFEQCYNGVCASLLTEDSPIAIVTKTTATSYTIGTTDSNEAYGGTVYVTGAATITAPAIAAGMSFTVITIGAVAVSVDVNAADRIYLDGTLLDDGDKATNTSTTGDLIHCEYYSADGWYCGSGSPDGDHWTDGGA